MDNSARTDRPAAKTASQRAAALRARDAAHRVRQLNLRVPEVYDVALQQLASDLRAGLRLEGFVVRDLKTGRLRTVII